MSIQQFCETLSNGNQNLNDKLMSFSKHFVMGTLNVPLTHIYGSGNDGKTTLVHYLMKLAALNGLKSVRLTYIDEYTKQQLVDDNVKYVIMEEMDDDTLKKISGFIKELEGDHNMNFVMVSNYALDKSNFDDGFLRRKKMIHLTGNLKNITKDPEMSSKLLDNNNANFHFLSNYSDCNNSINF